MENMVLEQYLKVLFPQVKSWVKMHNPERAEEAAELVDAYVTAHKGPGVYRYGGQLRPLEGKSEGFGKVVVQQITMLLRQNGLWSDFSLSLALVLPY